jgi:flavorubredoxin
MNKILRKILTITATVLCFLVIVALAGFSLIVFDLAGNLATDIQHIPNDNPIGHAIVVYNPGFSGVPKNVATKIAFDLQKRGYDVVLTGIKSSSAANLTGYNLIVVGGPVYMDKPSATVQTYVNQIDVPEMVPVGYFGYGSKYGSPNQYELNREIANPPSDAPISHSLGIKITFDDDMMQKCQEFVNRFG